MGENNIGEISITSEPTETSQSQQPKTSTVLPKSAETPRRYVPKKVESRRGFLGKLLRLVGYTTVAGATGAGVVAGLNTALDLQPLSKDPGLASQDTNNPIRPIVAAGNSNNSISIENAQMGGRTAGSVKGKSSGLAKKGP